MQLQQCRLPAKITTAEALSVPAVPIIDGTASTSIATTTPIPHRSARTRRSAAIRPRSRCGSAPMLNAEGPAPARPSLRRCINRAMTTTANSTGPTQAPSPDRSMPVCKMPRAIELAAIAPRFTMLPSTMAASARSRIVQLMTPPGGNPVIPACRNTARNDIAAAPAHTSVCNRNTAIPSIDAR